ncbi:hypothetical protein ACKWTF_010718 [Chironomus riparius]
MTMSKQVGNLEDEAFKRKERLKNLKRKFDDSKNEDKQNDSEIAKIEIPKPIFRNYKNDEEKSTIPETANIVEITEVAGVKEQLEEMKTPLEITDIDVSNLAPRKVDFDLKRAIAKKLHRLEIRTQKAISELIRERLKNQNEENDLAMNVNVGALETQAAKDIDSD